MLKLNRKKTAKEYFYGYQDYAVLSCRCQGRHYFCRRRSPARCTAFSFKADEMIGFLGTLAQTGIHLGTDIILDILYTTSNT